MTLASLAFYIRGRSAGHFRRKPAGARLPPSSRGGGPPATTDGREADEAKGADAKKDDRRRGGRGHRGLLPTTPSRKPGYHGTVCLVRRIRGHKDMGRS